jgi:signal-transduction protein with cAMP-binding, CBS, and nucleotidyltransferase domain
VWKATGNPHTGTLVAGWAGRAVAVLALPVPFVLQELGRQVTILDYVVAAVFAWFLWSAASAAIASAKVRSRLPALQARALARRTVGTAGELPLAEAVRQAQEAEAGSIIMLDPSGRPVGLVNEAAVTAMPEERRPWVPVSAVARTLDPGLTLPADIAGEALIRAMQQTPATEYLLVEDDGSVYGVLSTKDVDEAFEATR